MIMTKEDYEELLECLIFMQLSLYDRKQIGVVGVKIVETTVLKSFMLGDKIRHVTYILYADGTWEKQEHFVYYSTGLEGMEK